MSLEEYHRKRDFGRTPEPKGKRARRRKKGLRFVIHKHAATSLHYDLRLEFEGVYQSWAVPKGPSLDRKEKRLAVHVEDHPIDYGDFEGVIPEGEYGAGTVMIWDRGTWTPDVEPDEGMKKGDLKFTLAGEKLRGRWVLVRLRDGLPGDESKNWLLIKEEDDSVRSLDAGDILVEQPLSVASSRSMDEIAARPDFFWNMQEGRAESRREEAAPSVDLPDLDAIEGAKPGDLPSGMAPQLALLSDIAPDTDEWIHEIKYDGYRFICRVESADVKFLTRNGHDWTDKVPSLAEAAAELPVDSVMLDGEVVFLEPSGMTNFQALQNSFRRGQSGSLVYIVFDLLHLNGVDLTGAPLEERKAVLARFLNADEGRIRYSGHIEGNGPEFLRQAAKLSLEGIISKRRDRPYRPGGRSDEWRKIKCVKRQEFIVTGYTLPAGSRTGLGALVLGVHDEGELVYVGRVGTGFTDASLTDLRDRLDAMSVEETPFDSGPDEVLRHRETRWVRPELVASVEFTAWTDAGHLRHPTFRGLREDISPDRIEREGTSEGDAPVDFSHLEGLRDFYMTNPDRLFWPEQGITKLTLAGVFAEMSEWILPHFVGRPLSLLRSPEGYHKESFFQKHQSKGMPEGLFWTVLTDEGEEEEVLYIESVVGLMALVQMGVLEVHPWGSRLDRPDRPDRMIFDLDPDPSVGWAEVVDCAQALHERLDDLGLESFVKTTGGKGLHIVVPLQRRHSWKDVRIFARGVARAIASDAPRKFTLSPSKSERTGRIYIDTARNGRGSTAVGAYSTRSRAGAPMSVPLHWDEVSPGVKSDHFTVSNIRRRITSIGSDPWAEIDDVKQSLTAAMLKKIGVDPARED